ncbi:MAG: hypothetical protein AAGA81_19010 [Acidobacteriota bacterium]
MLRKTPHLASLAPCLLALLLCAAPTPAQLPPDAVDLSLVKIKEVQLSEELCPVHLVPSIADGETWTHDGVSYRGSEPGSKAEFMKAPADYAEKAKKQRWINNFMLAMSPVWCPVTGEISPGGRKRHEAEGYTWESCCSVCDGEMKMFPPEYDTALEKLAARAAESYELTGGEYVDADNPIEDAISW